MVRFIDLSSVVDVRLGDMLSGGSRSKRWFHVSMYAALRGASAWRG